MTKKISYLIFFVLVLITRTEHLNSMGQEQEKEDSKTMSTLLKISSKLSSDTAKIITRYKHSDSSEKDKEEEIRLKAVQLIWFSSSCGARSSAYAVPDADKTEYEANLALLQPSNDFDD